MPLRNATWLPNRTVCRTAILAILIGAFVAVQTTSAAQIPTIAVMPLQGKGVPATDADVITDAIATHMQQSPSHRVLERAQMDRILNEQGLAKSGACDGSECAVEMGKLISVDQILVGSVGLVGRTYTLNLRIVSVQTGEVLRSNMKSNPGSIDDVLTRMVPEAVADITRAPASAGRPKPETKPAAEASESKSGSRWGWWLAGGALLAGGAATAVILTTGSKDSPQPAPGTSPYNSVEVKW